MSQHTVAYLLDTGLTLSEATAIFAFTHFITIGAKLLWGTWHRTLGELAMLVRGTDALTAGPGYDLDEWQRLFLFTRADTIYGGSDEIQRNILAERVLGLPREPRPEVRP